MKTGSYAVTTVYSMPWTKKVAPVDKTKKKKVGKKVVHELFEKCAELTKDQYWISILNDCAREKFPRGFQYKNGLMIHRRGNRCVRKEIPETPAEAFQVTIEFFKSAGGLMSNTDRKRLQREEEERLIESYSKREITWKDIKIERVKESLISDYISDISNKRSLTADQKKSLTTVIKMGFMIKYFSSKNIIMSGGKITEIRGLIFENGNFKIDHKSVTKKTSRKTIGLGIEKTPQKHKLTPMIYWEKYLENVEKKKTGKKPSSNDIEASYSGDIPSPVENESPMAEESYDN